MTRWSPLGSQRYFQQMPTDATTAAITVAILNDYRLVAAGLAGVLEPFASEVQVVEVDSGTQVVSDVDVLLYDTFAQHQGNAIDMDSLFSGRGSAPVVIFSWNTDRELISSALAAGAAGYVSKSVTAEQLVAALRDVHRGEQVVLVPGADTGDDTGDDTDAGPDPLGRWPGDLLGLSPREGEVLALMCQGLSNQEITERAYIGINTVKTHIRTLYRKIEVESRSQAVAWGLSHGFAQRDTQELRSP